MARTVAGAALTLAGCAPDDGALGAGAQRVEGAALVATPASVDLGRVAVGASVRATVRLTNRGVDTIDITRVLPPGPCRTGLIAPCVRPGETTSMTLTCTPTAAGAFGGDVVVAYQAGGSDDALRVPVAGTAYNAR